MNILEIAKRVGSGLVRELVPGGGLLIDAVNQFLPDDKKLPPSASGDMVANTVSAMPPELQAAVMLKQFDVDLSLIDERKNATTQANDTLRVMLAQDAITPHTSRPWIARGCFVTLSGISFMFAAVYCYAVVISDDPLTAVNNSWPIFLALTGIFGILLKAYFGVLEKEQSNKLNSMNNLPTSAGSVISSLLKR